MNLVIQKHYMQNGCICNKQFFLELILSNNLLESVILIRDLPKGSRRFGFGLLKGASSIIQKYKIYYDYNKEYKFLEKIEWLSNKSSKLSWSLHVIYSSPFVIKYFVWSFSNKIVATEFALLF